MRTLYAIAALTVRGAARSRVLVSLAALLAVLVTALATSVKGDGTLPTQIRILVSYTVGLTAILLGAGTLWTAAGAVSQQIQNRSIHLIATKPVRPIQIWLGRWLGLLAANAALLLFVALLLIAGIHWKLRSAPPGSPDRLTIENEILVSRMSLPPRAHSVDGAAHAEFDRLIKEGAVPPDADHAKAIGMITARLLAQASTAAPEATLEWVFDLPTHMPRDARIALRYDFLNWTRDSAPATGTWTIGTEQDPERYKVNVTVNLDGVHLLDVPAGALRDGNEAQASSPAPNNQAIVRFANGRRAQTVSVVFKPKRGVELLIHRGSFAANLLRSLLIVLCYQGLIAALGLTAGVLFSFPVAAFTATCLIMISLLSHYFTVLSTPEHACKHHHHGPVKEPSRTRLAAEQVVRATSVLIEPCMQFSCIQPLSSGILVSWSSTGQAVGVLVLVYSGLLALAGGVILGRRELALPASEP